MIKNIILTLLLLTSSAMAEKAILVDIISENLLKIEHDGITQRIHLAGIELFAKANNATKAIDLDTKDEFKKQSLEYLKHNLKIGSEIKYHVLYEDTVGVKKVWLDKNELNYKIVRDGYALVDLNDPYLHEMFKMRMTIAMKYAKDKKLGLWGLSNNPLLSLINKEQHMCGWENQKMLTGITKLAILKEQQDALVKSSKEKKQTYLALNNNK